MTLTRELRALLVALVLIGGFGVGRAAAGEEPGPDGRSCAETTGREYISWPERDWYLANCTSQPYEGIVQLRLTAYRLPDVGAHLARIRWCESRDDYGAISPNGVNRGAWQFDYGTWYSVGGVGDPAAASVEEQDYRALLLYQQRGAQPWPWCGRV